MQMRHPMHVRIAYLVPWRGGRLTGPFQKVTAQAATWRALRHEVRLFVATTPETVNDWLQFDPDAVVLGTTHGDVAKLRERGQLAKEIARWQPDVVYERHGLWTPALGRLAKTFPTVVEVNGDDVREFRIESRMKGAYNRLTRSQFYGKAAGLTFVTNALARLPSFARFGKPHVVIGNGIDLAAVPELPPSDAPTPGLIWVGDARSPFQDVEQIIDLARVRPEWRFTVVGPAQPTGSSVPNIEWQPPAHPDDYRRFLAKADVGLGTLNAYRTGMIEASPLKIRDYLAHGVAAVIGCHDVDFPSPVPHLLEIPNTPRALLTSLAELDGFVHRWHRRRVNRRDVQHLDMHVKEEARLAFLASVAR
jgi:hypothetical protein